MKSKPDSNKADQEYVYDYDSDLTVKGHASRTAEKQASFFLPYLQPGMTLLDVGCASGSITVGLAKAVEGLHVTGVDISDVEIGRARERALEMNLANIDFMVGDVYQLGFPDNSFDALFSHDVLEHISEPGRALTEMRRVLKTGGVIGIRDVDYGGYLFTPDVLFEKYIAVWEADWVNAGGHPRLGRSLGRLLHDADFTEVETSVSYDDYSTLENRRMISEVFAGRLNETEYVERVIRKRLATAEDLEAMKEYWQTWQELPGAFFAVAQCEAIGRKA